MTKLSTDWTGAHWACALRVSRGNLSTEQADVLRAMGAYMVQGLALEASYNGGGRWFRGVRNVDCYAVCVIKSLAVHTQV